MALPATSTSPRTPSYPHSQPTWLAEHTQPTHRNSPTGQKRRADEVEDIEDRSHNISTNFKKLRINGNVLPTRSHPNAHPDSHASITSHPAYQPPSIHSLDESTLHQPQALLHPYSGAQHAPQSLQTHLHPLHAHLSFNRDFTHTPPPAPYLHPPSRTSTTTTLSDEPMALDVDPIPDPNRIVINDLSAELAEIEASERAEREQEQETAFFLPDDIEERISGVPAHILRNSHGNPSAGPDSQALVLYKDPTSISIPEDEDAVKKAVVEARRRMRERQKSPPPPSPFTNGHVRVHAPATDHADEAEPYIRSLTGWSNTTADTGSSRARYGREQTPFPFPNPNVCQPVMTAPYIPLDIDGDGIHVYDDDDDDLQSNDIRGGDTWDDDAMDIE